MPIVIDPDLASPSGYTLDDVVARVRRQLRDRETLNTLSQDMDEATDVVRFDHELETITKGTELNIDNEVCYVWSADPTAKTAKVKRGHFTTPEIHSAGTTITYGTQSRKEIVDTINDTLSTLSAKGLFQMRSADLSYNYAVSTYAIPALAASSVYDVQYQPWGQPGSWQHLSGWRFDAFSNSVTLPSISTGSLRVLYKAPYSKLTDGGDDIQVTSGLHAEAIDALVWGACYSLTTGDEYKRNDFRTQGDTRRANEVQYRAVALSRNDYKAKFDQRLGEELGRLGRFFPRIKAGF